MSLILTPEQLNEIDPPAGSPKRAGLIAELGTVLQPSRLLLGSSRLRRAPRGDGRISVFVPGWRAPDATTLPIRGYLHSLGHDVRSWGLGTNRGDVEALRDQMIPTVVAFAETSGRPVNLVGWSLGGVISREIARSAPDAVRRVVTYGTPVIDGPRHTAGASTYDDAEIERISELQRHLDGTEPISTPITAIFTRKDTVVDWRACIDRTSLDVTMIEVGSTHVGLGLDPDVWLAVAHALTEHDSD